MSSLSKQAQLSQLLEGQQKRIRQSFPFQTSRAVIALNNANDRRYLTLYTTENTMTPAETTPDADLYPSGWLKALQFCFDAKAEFSTASLPVIDSTLDVQAERVLRECDDLVKGEQVLMYCETGFMKLQQGGAIDFFAWIASKKMPTAWRERKDLAWWTNMLTTYYAPELEELTREKGLLQQQLQAFVSQWHTTTPLYKTTDEIDDYYQRSGRLWVKRMACHFLYPAQTQIGGCTVEMYRKILAVLIGWALKHLDLYRAFVSLHPSYPLRALLTTPHDVAILVEALSQDLNVEKETIGQVIDSFSLSRQNVSYHCSVAGTPAPPLLRIDEFHLVWSFMGLLSEPFLFLRREMKRRYSYEYHTASHLHEDVFRQDLYQLFSDKRFVKSPNSIELRGVQGDLTTDVDALIFDRKTGALALFELKSQDPFAYSDQERLRQRAYFYNAGKQISAWMQWLNRNGANTLLKRLDPKSVKHLKVQKTYIFVLGRYLAHFFDGPEFDQRAAWGTWPQVLQLTNEESFGADVAHPIQAFYNKLLKDTPLISSNPILETEEVTIGEHVLSIYPDFQMYKNRVSELEGGA